jgi:hypothetical protein
LPTNQFRPAYPHLFLEQLHSVIVEGCAASRERSFWTKACSMTPELARVARRSITIDHSMDISPQGIAERAIRACEVLSERLAAVVGKRGFCSLFKRCAQQFPARYSPRHTGPNPWAGAPQDDPWLWLQVSLEQHDSTTAAANFVFLLSEVVDLLHRLVGEAVMKALIEDVWPVAFPQMFEGRGPPS